MKKYRKNILSLLICMLLAVTTANAQVLPDVQTTFKQYSANTLQEKIFIHTDKNAYTAGELMWFKVYNVDGASHKPVDLSKVVYVEVLDKNQNPVLQAKIDMKDGKGSGSLFLPVSITSGNFLLRAYTGWMKNFSPDYYFYKRLTIINPLKSPMVQPKTVTADYDIQFFPEGGNLVNGISSVVGFKATNQYGIGVNFTGAIINKNNKDTVARFEPYKFGMGHFTLKPDGQAGYSAVIKIAGKTIVKDLPVVNSNGYVMAVKDNGTGQITVTVTTTQPAESVYLFAHTRNIIKTVETANTNNGTATFMLDKSKLGDGISHFTIFNSQHKPVCERLYFKRPVSQLLITATADQPQYNTRKKVTINIGTKNNSNTPAPADLSFSVYKIDSLQHADSEDIQNYLWLTSDLKGNIESPEYYFKNTDAAADEALDNLMLTQGWRRFAWADVLKNTKPDFKYLPEYNGPIITGKLTSSITGKPQKDVVAYLAIPGKRVQLYAAQSDTTGNLVFNMKPFYGPGEIVAETNTMLDTVYHIDINSPFSEQYAKTALPAFTVSAGMETTMQNHSINMQAQNLYNGEKLRQFYDPGVDSSAFYGIPYKTYLLDNYTRFTTIEEVMREYVSEVNISHSKNYFHILVLRGNTYINEGDPMVLVDGVPVFNMNKVFGLDPLKIRKLEDAPSVYLLGPSYESGIFSFTSYKGDLAGLELDPHAVVLDYDGLELQREFYSPAYDTEAATISRIPDLRNVLYWAPFVNTNMQGKSSLSFYTSDQTGKYIGIIQGLTANGEAGSRYFMFDVVK